MVRYIFRREGISYFSLFASNSFIQAIYWGIVIGQMTFSEEKVLGVWVEDGYRRQGIATTMLECAEEIRGHTLIMSSPRTTDGESWAGIISKERGNEMLSNTTPYRNKYEPVIFQDLPMFYV